MNWCLHGVHARETDATLGQFSDEAWFQPSGCMASQNNMRVVMKKVPCSSTKYQCVASSLVCGVL